MYERLRTDFIGNLMEMQLDNIDNIVQALDEVAVRYNVSEQTTELTVYANAEALRLVDQYLICKKVENRSDKTIIRYKYILYNFAKKLQVPFSELTANDLRLYLHMYQKERQITDRSLESIRIVLSSFFNWLAAEEYITSNPMIKIKPIAYEHKPRRAINQFKLEEIRQACTDDRISCIAGFMFSTGCRVSELCDVKIEDVNFDTKEVHLFGKGRKHRTSYISPRAELAIRKYLNSRKHASEYLLCNERGGGKMSKSNIERMFRKIAHAVGLDGILTPHVMRHTTATIALQNGMKINQVQQLLGHENISTTMIYAETDKESVKADHKKYIN